MAMFWTSVGFLSLVVIAAVVYPLMRRGARAADQTTPGVGVYREQLAEIDRELASGLLTEEQAVAARLEIERRIIAIPRAAKTSSAGIGVLGRRLAVAAVVLGLPAGAVPLYLYLGMPHQLDRPLAQRTEELKLREQAQQLDEFSNTLVARLEERPDDVEAWVMLGRLYNMLRRFSESADAYGRVHALRPGEADAAVDHGEALVYASRGFVSDAAKKLFVAALESNPKHLKARFYLGSALAQRSDQIPKAIEVWSGLVKDAPPDAPWLETVRRNLRVAEAELADLTEARPEIKPDAGMRGADAQE